MQDSLQSSDQILVVQSPTVKKFLTNVGFLSRLITGPYCALNLVAIFSPGVLPFRFPDITTPNYKNRCLKIEKCKYINSQFVITIFKTAHKSCTHRRFKL